MRDEFEREYVQYVEARLPALRRTAYLLTGDEHRADDTVQQALTLLYVRWRRARQADHLDGYVRRMVVNAFLEERRRGWARVRLLGELPDRPDRPGGPPDEPEDRQVLHAALLSVPPRQRAALVLRFLHDLSVGEVAEILGCSEGTVKSQTARGLATLRQQLGVAAPSHTRRAP